MSSKNVQVTEGFRNEQNLVLDILENEEPVKREKDRCNIFVGLVADDDSSCRVLYNLELMSSGKRRDNHIIVIQSRDDRSINQSLCEC